MKPRIFLDAQIPQRAAAIYAMRELLEPLQVEVIVGPEYTAEATSADVLCSYGPSVPEHPACPTIHIMSNQDFWSFFLRPESLPQRPFARIPWCDLGFQDLLREPLAFPFMGGCEDTLFVFEPGPPGLIVASADLVASAFYFLTRYEEALVGIRDSWGRVPEERTSIVQEGLEERAPVDEYREVLAGWLSMLLGRPIEPLARGYEVLFTHDVDHGFRVRRGAFWWPVARGMGRDLLRHRSARTSLELGVNAIAAALGLDPPFGGVKDILRLAERFGWTSCFFFMANGTHPIDATYDVNDLRSVLQRILESGHKVGLHAGLNAACDAAQFRREWDLLVENLGCSPFGVRTHYLRFDPLLTPRLLDEVGARMDSSAGFSLRCGFRTGTTRPHKLFDLSRLRPLEVYEYPLVLMDKAIYNLPEATRRERVSRVLTTVRRFGGCFTLDWHYWNFTHYYRRICKEVLEACSTGKNATLP